MNFINSSRAVFAALAALSILALAPAPTVAQIEPRSVAGQAIALPGPAVPCPQPISLKLTHGGQGVHTAGQPDPADFGSLPGGTYNQTSINQWFRDSFHFKTSNSKCCQFKDGKLTVVYRALQAGPPNSSTSANDDGGVWSGSGLLTGASGGRIFPGAVILGQMATFNYVVPASLIASGKVSFAAEDDTAVVSATLEISGCCLDPTPIR
jgi:hypothetical protein